MLTSAQRVLLLLLSMAAVAALVGVNAVDRNNFKTCDKSGFCQRSRKLTDPDQVDKNLLYNVVPGSLRMDGPGKVVAELSSPHSPSVLALELFVFADKQLRLRINEKKPLLARYEVQDVIVELPPLADDTKIVPSAGNTVVTSGTLELLVQHTPFHIDVFDSKVLTLVFNRKQLLEIEHLRTREDDETAQQKLRQQEQEDDTTQNADLEATEDDQPKQAEAASKRNHWEETFKSYTDKKPHGPEAVSLDITFADMVYLYGIPEHAAPLNLPDTKGAEAKYSDPYRLYNLDVFEYELDNPMALYGSVPFMMAHRVGKTAAILWLNAAETWIDVMRARGMIATDSYTHWLSESGIIDIFAFIGASPKDVLRKYTSITGKPSLPRMFAIAYHQCRWNYNDEQDVAAVNEGFETHDIPYDVLWLDIEHTDSKKYFTWDSAKFPHPVDMQNNLAQKSRKMVTIIDPHIKRVNDYYIHSEALSKDLYVKDDNNNPFEGWCWPGSSSWIDFTNPTARKWWAEKFAFSQYSGSTSNLFTWNDMNEPSVFNGPEVTMPKHNVHHNGWEHRDVHNIYGSYQFMATSDALTLRDNKRPFVLSRAFYAGSQRYGALWTGDNTSNFEHLKASIPMLLSIGVAGIPFIGADVGGFFGNPNAELFTRWYEIGAFQPFFRGHAHLDSRRREPWVFGEPYTSHVRAAIRRRYALLPYWYTLFHEAAIDGTPVMRPLFFEFPAEETVFAKDNAFMVGSAIFVHPVTEADSVQQNVVFPGGASQLWYTYDTYRQYKGGAVVVYDAPLGTVPVFIRGGSIFPRRDRVRRSSALMHADPYTLIVALDSKGEATGRIYVDDGESFNYKQGSYADKRIVFKGNALMSEDFTLPPNHQMSAYNAFAKSYGPKYERIVIVGLTRMPKTVTCNQQLVSFSTDFTSSVLTLKLPPVKVADNWTIQLS